MTERASPPPTPRFDAVAIGVMIFVAAIHLAWWALGDTIVLHGGLADGDSFTRLLRVERLIETGDWLDISIPDANAPFGTTVHWTRLFDILLLTLSAPLVPILGFSEALFWAGVIISPLIHLILVAAIIWATQPFLGRAGALIAAGLTATQFGILAFAIIGRADHHLMFALVIILTIGFLSRAYGGIRPGRNAWAAGVSLATGIWIGPEFLLFMAICVASTGLPWLTRDHVAGHRSLALSLGLVTGLGVALLIERGPIGILDIEYDRLSIVHFTMALLLFVFWFAAVRIIDLRAWFDTTGRRIIVAGAGAGALTVIMAMIFPDVLSNPLTNVDPALIPIYAHISEYGAVTDLAQFLIYFGSLLFAAPWLVLQFRSQWSGAHRWTWALLAVGLVTFSAFGLGWIRWSLYAAVFTTIVLAGVIVQLDSAIDAWLAFPARVPVKVIALVAVAVGPLVLAGTMRYMEKTPAERAAEKRDDCPVWALSQALNAPPFSSKSRVIVASANFGPELIYRTGHRAVATVHHRNAAGILDGYRILSGADDKTAQGLIRKRQVDLLVICPDNGADGYFVADTHPRSLYQRLATGTPPPWLRAVQFSDTPIGKFRVFEVVGNK